MVALSVEPEFRETHKKVIKFLHLVCTDQTGKDEVQFSSVNKYLMVLCGCNAKAILAEPIPNRKTETLQETEPKVLAQINKKGIQTY